MDENIKNFLKEDNIDISKFLANSEIMKNETKEIYQATARLHSQIDISDNATKTIHWMALIYNQPLGYPKWFMTAYPDVVFWVSNLTEEITEGNILPFIGEISEKDLDGNREFLLSFLRKIVDAYKNINKLECC